MASQRTAIVFGGAGFIGTALLRSLRDGGAFSQLISADICPPARFVEGVQYETCDVRDPISLEGDFGDVEIFNFAAVHTTPGHEDWEYFWTNLNGAIEVCRFATRAGAKRLTFTSSISVYGPTGFPRDEAGPFTPESAYGRSKLMAEKIHADWQGAGPDRKLIIVRPAVVFGPGEKGNFTRLATALRKRRFAFPGRSDTIKACAYVGELVRSILYVRDLDASKTVFNLAYPRVYTSRDICTAFHQVAGYTMPKFTMPLWTMMLLGTAFEAAALLGFKTSINRARMAKLVNSTHIVPRRLEELGYRFETDLTEGLRRWGNETGGRFQ
jgi:nucleoside-diphosphate-sugar epimerase